jgi:ribonucleoside-diphosphate reductase alpha chain
MRVTKRSGKVEDVRFDKVVTRISNLTHGLSPVVDSSKIAQQVFSSMYDGIHTNEIDTLSAEICVGMITSDPDYETLATRIVASNIQKTAPNNFHLAMKKLRTAGVVTDDVVKVAALVKDKILPERDFDFGYFGLKTLEKSYLQKVDGKIIETPQYMFMRVAIGIHGDSLDDVLDTYDSMSRGLFTHATPTLFNAGTPRPQMSSCFLVANKSDSIDGVYGTITECAQISKWAGGIGVHIHDVRANKSYIRGTNGASDGIIPMLRVYNATARYVNQAGKRKGSIAVYLEPWHPDIMDFLELRLNQGDEEARCRDLFTALWIPDLFMKRVEEDGQWSLFCPDTAKGLSNCTGEEFEALYRKYEDEGLARETVPAQRVWKAILKSQVETGTPYMLYKDAINEKSNQKNLGVIKSSNLCVAPETNILTSEGYQTISHLKDQQVDVWNGFEWSPVVVRQTGVDQKLLTVTTSLGLSVRCTPYHKFPILSESDTKRPFECKDFVFVEAKDLKPGMCLIKHDLPLIEISDEKMKYAYTHGFFCADGTTSRPGEVHRCEFRAKKNGFCMRHQARVAEYEDDGRCQANSCVENKYIDLYHGKRELIKYIEHDLASVGEELKKIRCRLPFDIEDKYFVPINYSVETKLEWLSGLLDGDGCAVSHIEGNGCSIQLASINKKFLCDIVYMLQTLGCHSSIRPMHGERQTSIISGTYNCKASWRLLIASKAVEHLQAIGMSPRRLKLNGTSNRNATHYQRIVSVEDLDETADTYCFTEHKRNMGMFNGMLLGNCSEIAEYTAPDETAVCNLASIALPKFVKDGVFDHEGLHQVAKKVTRNLNRVIDKNFYPVESARKSNMRHRPIGIGVQGLADVFILMGHPFDSPEARKVNAEIFETIYHGALEMSHDLATVEGAYETFEGSPFSQGVLQFDMWEGGGEGLLSGRYDWDALKEKVKTGVRNSLLLAPMPTASTAQILGNNECFEPYTTNIYLRRTLAGEFVVVNKHLVKNLQEKGLWSKQMKDLMVKAGGSVQNIVDIPPDTKALFKTVWEISQKVVIDMARDRGHFIDQTQSMNLFMESPTFAKLSSMHMYAWKAGLKTGMYYLRSQPKARPIQFSLEPDCVACSA